MSVVVLDGSTVRAFVSDEEAFTKSVDGRFASLDLNGDGVLSRSELRRALETFRLMETHFGVDAVTPPEQISALYDSIFDQFDCDGSGTVDLPEFRSEMKKILLAIADGLGSSPIQVAIDEDLNGGQSFLREAVDLEAAKLAAGDKN
ncbi:calcium-dependent protein kinase [Apostasia shenzhenica]|uniref:Calcium-dependent protein kinase n=1 Tax=Apostasia shenzhenica TaxID=1088818 RepID=A0A2I0AZR0_9ASPA|nr:calcium-dependent protein kinase [Apostasia shenzhenica]